MNTQMKHLRAVDWAHRERLCLGGASAELAGSSGNCRTEIFMHTLSKRATDARGGADVTSSNLGTTIGVDQPAAAPELASMCERCGLVKAESRYKSTRAWQGHLKYCRSDCPTDVFS